MLDQDRGNQQRTVKRKLLPGWVYLIFKQEAVDARRGQVAAAIAEQASAWRADVIVLTRRPRPTISRMILGSGTDQVMRKASCPVLAVHPNRK
jgi:nucleotide-binding universal stress UspA family protein